MAESITQRELRNDSGEIMRRLDQGESFVVTRNGVPVGELTPLRRHRFVTAGARNDPDAQPLTPKRLKAMVPLRSLRGRPKSESKKLLVSVRYSPEVVAYFKSTGEGWQSRMDSVLREYVERHSRRA
jgi:prevent-host-death family protein